MEACIGIKDRIFEQIQASPAHSVFFIKDFSALGSTITIRKALQEATERGMLEHIAHGIYVKPMQSRFGIVPVPLEVVASEIAKRDNVQIMPTGETAANIIGISTQIPMVVSFLTTGSSRSIQVGNRSIQFRHAAPRNFAYAGTTVPLIVQAFKSIGKDNVTSSDLSAAKSYMLKSPDKPVLEEDLLIAPEWIRSVLKTQLK